MATISSLALDGIPLPGGETVVKVLASVFDLCKQVGAGSASCLALHARLLAILHQLEDLDARGEPQREAVALFTTTLDKFWRHLGAYARMTTVERLLRHRKWQRVITSVHEDVDELSRMIGLATGDYDSRRQHALAMDAQLAELVAIAQDTNELLDELRGVRDQQDAAVLLKHALEQIKAGESKLPVQAHAAVRSALHTIVSASNLALEPKSRWFVSEADVAFAEKPFARGSFATVHRGPVGAVVKMLLPDERGLGANLQQSLLAEASVWHSMRHPNVVRLLGACHVMSRPLLVCEDAANGSMNDYLNREPNHRQHVWRLLHETAQGLLYLHSKSVVHGDRRLSNVLVTRDQTAVLTDFGLSRIKNKAKGESVPASDVYALAMTMLEAFTGESPYAGVRDESEVKIKPTSRRRHRGLSSKSRYTFLSREPNITTVSLTQSPAHPTSHVRHRLSAASIRSVVDKLEDSADPLAREQLACDLAMIAQHERGAQLIGSRGGVAVLVGLLIDSSERLRRSALLALTQLVEERVERRDVYLLRSEYADERDAAAQVLEQLVRRSTSAARAIHGAGGFAAMLELARNQNAGIIDDIVLTAIDTLLRAPRRNDQPHEELRADRAVRVAA